VAELPGDPSDAYYVRRLEFGNGGYSHHLIVSAAVPGSPADPTTPAAKRLKARSAFNVHLGKLEDIRHRARGFSFSNYMVDTPTGQPGSC
jgi:hypothetical protein